MLDTFKKLIANQLEAALCMLNACIDACPDAVWTSRVANYKFCQVSTRAIEPALETRRQGGHPLGGIRVARGGFTSERLTCSSPGSCALSRFVAYYEARYRTGSAL